MNEASSKSTKPHTPSYIILDFLQKFILPGFFSKLEKTNTQDKCHSFLKVGNNILNKSLFSLFFISYTRTDPRREEKQIRRPNQGQTNET